MYKLHYTKTFERKIKAFLKRHPELESAIAERADTLAVNPFDRELKTHKLSGRLRNNWAISLTYEYRILFTVEDDRIYLTNIGSHDDVY